MYRKEVDMFVIVWHELVDPPTAFARGELLKRGEDAPAGVHVLQFYPGTDGRSVTCLWESDTVDAVQSYVDDTLGDASRNTCYAVAESAAFAELPTGVARSAAAVAA
jgi:hypothetical protein